MKVRSALARSLAVALVCAGSTIATPALAQRAQQRSPTNYRSDGWQRLGWGAIRGATLGPIESSVHPGVGYGTPASEEALDELARLGCNWVSITPFGRQWDLRHTDIQLDFEQPFERNREAIRRVIAQARAGCGSCSFRTCGSTRRGCGAARSTRGAKSVGSRGFGATRGS